MPQKKGVTGIELTAAASCIQVGISYSSLWRWPTSMWCSLGHIIVCSANLAFSCKLPNNSITTGRYFSPKKYTERERERQDHFTHEEGPKANSSFLYSAASRSRSREAIGHSPHCSHIASITPCPDIPLHAEKPFLGSTCPGSLFPRGTPLDALPPLSLQEVMGLPREEPQTAGAEAAPTAMQEETLRRMELLVLHLLSVIVSSSSPIATASKKEACGTNTERTIPFPVPSTLSPPTTGETTLPHFTSSNLKGEEKQRRKRTPHNLRADTCVGPPQPSGLPVLNSRLLREMRQLLVCLPPLYQGVQLGITITQRDLYYHMVRQLPHQRASDTCVRRLSTVLRLPRRALHVVAGQRGSIGGSITTITRGEIERGAYNGGGEVGEMVQQRPQRSKNGWWFPCTREIPIPADEALLSVVPWGADIGGGQAAMEEGIQVWDGNTSKQPAHREAATSGVPMHDSRSAETESSSCAALRPPSLTDSLPLFLLRRDTRAVIVVEKYTVYHRLMEEGFPQRFPCVVLTSQGFPTQSARRLLAHIAFALRERYPGSEPAPFDSIPAASQEGAGRQSGSRPPKTVWSSSPAFPNHQRPVLLALGDYNPSGLRIIWQYKFGSAAASSPFTAAERHLCRVPDLRWVGLRSHHVLLEQLSSAALEASTRGGTPGVPLPRPTRDPPAAPAEGARFLCLCPHTAFSPRDAAMMQTLLDDVAVLQSTYAELLLGAHETKKKGREGGTKPVGETADVQKRRRTETAPSAGSEVIPNRDVPPHMLSNGGGGADDADDVRCCNEWAGVVAEMLFYCPDYNPLRSHSELRQHLCAARAAKAGDAGAPNGSGMKNEPDSQGGGGPPLPPIEETNRSFDASAGFLQSWLREVRTMLAAGVKVELEALIDQQQLPAPPAPGSAAVAVPRPSLAFSQALPQLQSEKSTPVGVDRAADTSRRVPWNTTDDAARATSSAVYGVPPQRSFFFSPPSPHTVASGKEEAAAAGCSAVPSEAATQLCVPGGSLLEDRLATSVARPTTQTGPGALCFYRDGGVTASGQRSLSPTRRLPETGSLQLQTPQQQPPIKPRREGGGRVNEAGVDSGSSSRCQGQGYAALLHLCPSSHSSSLIDCSFLLLDYYTNNNGCQLIHINIYISPSPPFHLISIVLFSSCIIFGPPLLRVRLWNARVAQLFSSPGSLSLVFNGVPAEWGGSRAGETAPTTYSAAPEKSPQDIFTVGLALHPSWRCQHSNTLSPAGARGRACAAATLPYGTFLGVCGAQGENKPSFHLRVAAFHIDALFAPDAPIAAPRRRLREGEGDHRTPQVRGAEPKNKKENDPPLNLEGCRWRYPTVPEQLRRLVAAGYTLALWATREKGYKGRAGCVHPFGQEGAKSCSLSALSRAAACLSAVRHVLRSTALPVLLVGVVEGDGGRGRESHLYWCRPSPVLWEQMERTVVHELIAAWRETSARTAPTSVNCRRESFYCGPEAGRAGDRGSCRDRKFAFNIGGGLTFCLPECMFQAAEERKMFHRNGRLHRKACERATIAEPFSWCGLDPTRYTCVPSLRGWQLDTSGTCRVTQLGLQKGYASLRRRDGRQELVLLVGLPGCGKTTFYRRFFAPLGYAHINRDTLGTKAKCLKAAAAAWSEGKSVVIDNTNPTSAGRREYITMIAEAVGRRGSAASSRTPLPVRVFVFTHTIEEAMHMNAVRARAGLLPSTIPKVAYFNFSRQYNAYTKEVIRAERIEAVYNVPPVLCFDGLPPAVRDHFFQLY
eukprot:gene7010-4972_t